MADLSFHRRRRKELKQRYLLAEGRIPAAASTGGVDHLALISFDLEATIEF